MGQTTKTIVSDALPVGIILLLMFFFLETAIGKKLLQDLWNMITKGLVPSDKGSTSDTQTQTNVVNSNSNSGGSSGGGSGSETLAPPPDVSHSLEVKNSGGSSGGGSGGGSSSSGSGNGGQTQTTTTAPPQTPEPVTAPTTTNSQRPTSPQVLSPVQMVKKLFSGDFSYAPMSTVYYNSMPEQNTSKQPTQTATTTAPQPPTPNPSTVPAVSTDTTVPNPLPQTPDLLTQAETSLAGVGGELASGLTALQSDLSGLKFPTNLLGLPTPFSSPTVTLPEIVA